MFLLPLLTIAPQHPDDHRVSEYGRYGESSPRGAYYRYGCHVSRPVASTTECLRHVLILIDIFFTPILARWHLEISIACIISYTQKGRSNLKIRAASQPSARCAVGCLYFGFPTRYRRPSYSQETKVCEVRDSDLLRLTRKPQTRDLASERFGLRSTKQLKRLVRLPLW